MHFRTSLQHAPLHLAYRYNNDECLERWKAL